MTDPTNPIPAGWYPDPAGGPRPRWWDGTAWTEHYADPAPAQSATGSTGGYDPAQPYAPGFAAGAASGSAAGSAYPAAAPYSTAGTQLTAPAGTRTNTPWIWLLVFLPLVSYIPLLFLDLNDYLTQVAANPDDTFQAELSLYTSPAMIAATLLGLAVLGLSILFAVLDWRALKSAGVPQPFHFAWVLFIFVIGSAAVYTIGRAVVVKRRTGSGLAPMWWTIVVLVVGLVVGIGFAVAVISQMLAMVPQLATGLSS